MQKQTIKSVVVVNHTSFIAYSRASQEALKSANLLKSLNINALITGESGTGKRSLAKFILPKAEVVDGSSFAEVLSIVSTNSEIVIKNFDKITNFTTLQNALQKHQTRVIATSKIELQEKISSEFFSLKITIPPLIQREEDIEPLAKKFFEEVYTIFGKQIQNDISLENLSPDLSQNCYSLRRSVYIKYIIDSLEKEDVLQVMEEFLSKKLGGKNDYREQLYLFDVPMLRSGFKKFHSQLNMSEKFGLNRNTLRKKINDYKDDYELQKGKK